MTDPTSTLLLSNSYDHVLGAREATAAYLEQHPDAVKQIHDHLLAYMYLQMLIPQSVQRITSGHILPYSESQIELESSTQLAFMAFYKPAMICLRNCLELGLLSVFYDANDDSEVVIQEWLHSREDTPFKRRIIDGLSRIDNVSALNFRIPLLDRVSALYRELSNYVHTAGYRYSARELNYANFCMFQEKAFNCWFTHLKAVVGTLSMLFLCKYPIGFHYTPMDEKFGIEGPLAGFLNPHQSNLVKSCIGAEYMPALENICGNDAKALELAEWVNARPDITNEEWDAQFERENKRDIENYGYRYWYEHIEKPLIDSSKEYADYMNARLPALGAWAQSQGWYEKGTVHLPPDTSAEKP